MEIVTPLQIKGEVAISISPQVKIRLQGRETRVVACLRQGRKGCSVCGISAGASCGYGEDAVRERRGCRAGTAETSCGNGGNLPPNDIDMAANVCNLAANICSNGGKSGPCTGSGRKSVVQGIGKRHGARMPTARRRGSHASGGGNAPHRKCFLFAYVSWPSRLAWEDLVGRKNLGNLQVSSGLPRKRVFW